MNQFSDILKRRMLSRDQLGLQRVLRPPSGIDFTSNDYLGFVTDEELISKFHTQLKMLPLGSTGSRLLRGELPLFENVESTLARFSTQEAALLFPSDTRQTWGCYPHF
jgi:8-amino-7-oxononanoate synthase